MDKLKLSTQEYFDLIGQLYKKIPWEKEKFDYIIGVQRAGTPIAFIFSHLRKLPFDIVYKNQAINVRGNVLIVDEVSDSGSTLLQVVSNLKTTTFATATLHIKPGTRFKPNYYVKEETRWISYPYEEDNFQLFDIGDLTC